MYSCISLRWVIAVLRYWGYWCTGVSGVFEVMYWGCFLGVLVCGEIEGLMCYTHSSSYYGVEVLGVLAYRCSQY